MARAFRQSRFRNRGEVGEDVNPSAYIVNLADCMLVLACGFMVALISYWNIDVTPATEIEGEQLEEVNPETLPEDISEGGSYYIEAGKVYQDPNTGQLYMVQESGTDTDAGDADGEGESAPSSKGNSNAAASGSSARAASGSASGGVDDESVRNARAAGAD